MNFSEKTISSRSVYRGRILNLKVDEVELPDGNHSIREIVEHKNGVAILPVYGDKIIFVRQFRKPIEKMLLEIPAGLVEAGEATDEAAVRELEEEIGLKPLDLQLMGEMLPSPGFCAEVTTLFIASQFEEKSRPQDDDEFIEVVEMPIKEVRERFIKGEFIDAKTSCALGRFFTLA